MSSDVQTETTRGSGDAVVAARGLEDLKEVTDETEFADARLLVTDNKDPDILYIPLNILNLNPRYVFPSGRVSRSPKQRSISRNSFPPGKDILPFQHIMRSFSDSHLCIKITTAPTPSYSFGSPLSSSPSILFLDITEKSIDHLRRTKATASLIGECRSGEYDDVRQFFRGRLIFVSVYVSSQHQHRIERRKFADLDRRRRRPFGMLDLGRRIHPALDAFGRHENGASTAQRLVRTGVRQNGTGGLEFEFIERRLEGTMEEGGGRSNPRTNIVVDFAEHPRK